jgi:hypothetical protein
MTQRMRGAPQVPPLHQEGAGAERVQYANPLRKGTKGKGIPVFVAPQRRQADN